MTTNQRTPGAGEAGPARVRDLFLAVVEARLGLLEVGGWLRDWKMRHGAAVAEVEDASESLEGAIRSLYAAEDAINGLHRDLMVALAVGGHGCPPENFNEPPASGAKKFL